MSLARIKRAKKKQVRREAKYQELLADIKHQKVQQAFAQLDAEKLNADIAKVGTKIARKNLSIANTNYNISIVKDGAAKDLHGYEKAARLLKQHEYKAKLELAEINLNEAIANNHHLVSYNGDTKTQLLSPVQLELPQVEFLAT